MLIDGCNQMDADYDWALNDLEVQRAHGGLVVAAHGHRIWGTGQTHAEALRAAQAEPGCPPRGNLALVAVPYLMADTLEEYRWCLEDEEVQREHGGLVAAIHGHRVWGSGADRAAAWETACRQPGCPGAQEIVFVLIPSVTAESDLP